MVIESVSLIFPFKMESIVKGLKYLGFILKLNGYKKGDSSWILKNEMEEGQTKA